MYEVVIALGSNLGNRGQHLCTALRALSQRGVQILRHSCLYETAAAYVTNQPAFLNAAVLGRTHLPPLQLLSELKQIEAEAGREFQNSLRWGPRPLDLDIILYGDRSLNEEVLQVPHPRCHEREFVMMPMRDLLYRRDTAAGRLLLKPSSGCSSSGISGTPVQPAASEGCAMLAQSPVTQSNSAQDLSVYRRLHALIGHRQQSSSRSYGRHDINAPSSSGKGGHAQHLQAVMSPSPSTEANAFVPSSTEGLEPPAPSSAHARSGATSSSGSSSSNSSSVGGDVLRRVVPLPDGSMLPVSDHTLVMGILNVTPDSFSDGGLHEGVAGAVVQARQMLREGADILDVGGQSTRPGAARVSAEEEAARVIPVIRALHNDPELKEAVISIDTFYASVAANAVAEGASIVNDVSGGLLDPHMHSQVASLGVPYVLMHMRGDPTTMQQSQHTTYECAWREVGQELQAAAEAAVLAGVPAWNIILDPGLGFAKTTTSSLELMRELPRMRSQALDGPFAHAPMLFGPSRKGFLGRLTGKMDTKDRDAATVGACVVCGERGADIVRVHAVGAVVDGLRVADAVYRGGCMRS